MIVNEPKYDGNIKCCGVQTGLGWCPEPGVRRVQIDTYEFDHTEWAPYVGQEVWVVVCKRHADEIEADYARVRAAEDEREAARAKVAERVNELEDQLKAAQRELDSMH